MEKVITWRRRLVILGVLLSGAWAADARAETTASAGFPSLLSGGISLGGHSRGGRVVGGEAAVWLLPVGSKVLYGIDAGITRSTWFTEAQIAYPALLRKDLRLEVLLGLSAGVVRATEVPPNAFGVATRTGFQATTWALFAREIPLPLIPYARVERYSDETVVGGGLMLRFAIPLWPPLSKQQRPQP
jgi:hypothetical protein